MGSSIYWPPGVIFRKYLFGHICGHMLVTRAWQNCLNVVLTCMPTPAPLEIWIGCKAVYRYFFSQKIFFPTYLGIKLDNIILACTQKYLWTSSGKMTQLFNVFPYLSWASPGHLVAVKNAHVRMFKFIFFFLATENVCERSLFLCICALGCALYGPRMHT